MDSWYSKKSVVDVIFRVGHWDARLAQLYTEDRERNPRKRAPADSQGAKQEKTPAQKASAARHKARYERRRRQKWATRMTSY